jgi:hypothetical protein
VAIGECDAIEECGAIEERAAIEKHAPIQECTATKNADRSKNVLRLKNVRTLNYPGAPTFGTLFFDIFATLVYFQELSEKLKTPKKKDIVDRVNLSKNLFL